MGILSTLGDDSERMLSTAIQEHTIQGYNTRVNRAAQSLTMADLALLAINQAYVSSAAVE